MIRFTHPSLETINFALTCWGRKGLMRTLAGVLSGTFGVLLIHDVPNNLAY